MANKPNNDNFDDYDEFLDVSNELFPPEWYDKVTDAINFTMTILEKNGKILKNRDEIIKSIIDYNIEKTLNDNINLIPLPKVYDWSKADAVEIFEEFAYLLNLIKIKPAFEEHKIIIKFGNNIRGRDYFDFWKNMSLDEIRNLELIIKDISKTKIECTIKKIAKK